MSLNVVGSDYCTTELVAATNASATTLIVSTPTEAFPTLVGGAYCYLTIVDQASYAIDANPPNQREIVKVTAVAQVADGFELTCARGVGGTTAQIWASGSVAEIRPCQQWFEDLKSTGGADWLITDGIVTVNPVDQLFVGATGAAYIAVTDLGGGVAALTIGATGASGGSISVTDGGTTVDPTTEINFTSGATVTNLGGGVAGVAISGGGGSSFSQSQAFTSSGTFTPDSGVTGVWVTMIAGGGGGASFASSIGGGGGGSGEYCVSQPYDVSGGPVTVTVGAGGSGGSAGAGGAGDPSSFGSLIARGGLGGTNSLSASGAGGGINGSISKAQSAPGTLGTLESPTFFGGSAGGGGGTSVPGNGAIGGANASFPTGAAGGAAAAGQGGGGGGGNSPFGVGGAGGSNSNGTAASGTSYGAGGGGASGKASTNYVGGNGANGYCLVTWIGP